MAQTRLWPWTGRCAASEPLAGEMAGLVGYSATLNDIKTAEWDRVENVALDAYMAGLRAGGWDGDVNHVRLGYTAWLGLYGAAIPNLVACWTTDKFRPLIPKTFDCSTTEEFIANQLALCEIKLARADEARHLMKALHLV